MNHTNQENLKVLLVEDNPGDVRLFRESLKKTKHSIELYVAEDGAEALDFLYQQNEHANAPRPDLILLDLNLPKVNGFEVLNRIKDDNELKHIRVVVLTVSDAESDVARSKNCRANCYTTKPMDAGRFETIVQTFEDFKFNENFWFTIMKSDGQDEHLPSYVPVIVKEFMPV